MSINECKARNCSKRFTVIQCPNMFCCILKEDKENNENFPDSKVSGVCRVLIFRDVICAHCGAGELQMRTFTYYRAINIFMYEINVGVGLCKFLVM